MRGKHRGAWRGGRREGIGDHGLSRRSLRGNKLVRVELESQN